MARRHAQRPLAAIAVCFGLALPGLTLSGLTLSGLTLSGLTLSGLALPGLTLSGLALSGLGCAPAPPPRAATPTPGARGDAAPGPRGDAAPGARGDAAPGARGDAANDAQIDALMAAFHRGGWFDGSVLVAKHGAVIYRGAFGLAHREWGVPTTVDARYRIASITKTFTAALVLELVEQGKLRLDGKLTDYLPDYRRDTGNRVTIHHLLNHTSGIPDYANLPEVLKRLGAAP